MMKKTIKRVTSIIMATMVALSPMSGLVGPMVAHAAETKISISDCTYEESGTSVILTGYSGTGNTVDESALLAEIQTTKPTINNIEIGATFLASMSGDVIIGDGVDINGKPTKAPNITSIEYKGNNSIVGVAADEFLTETYKDWTSLTKVVGLGNVLNTVSASDISDTVYLDKTFSGCTALEEVKIDCKVPGTWIGFTETFNDCTSLRTFTVMNSKVAKVQLLNITDNSCPGDIKVTFSGVTFAGTDTTVNNALSFAFDGMAGTYTFQSCDSTSSDGISLGGAFAKHINSTGKDRTVQENSDIFVILDNTKVRSIENMFSGTHANVSLNNLVTTDTKNISGALTGTFKSITGINTWDTSGVDEEIKDILHNFKCNTETETNKVISAVKSLNLTTAPSYVDLFATLNEDKIDLTGIELSGSSDSILKYQNSNKDYLITPRTFGGKYYIKTKVYSINDSTGEYTEITPDSTIDEASVKYYIYESSTLSPETKYGISASTVKIVDVANPESPIFRYFLPGTTVLNVLDENVEYFTDESLATPLTSSTKTSKNDTIVVYYTSDTTKPGGGEGNKDVNYDVTFSMPSGFTAEFTVDPTVIEATLDDGTVRKLAKDDGDIITIKINGVKTPDSYAQAADFGNYALNHFYTLEITIRNADKTYNVKSLSEPVLIRSGTDSLDHFDSRKHAVYAYPNGITKSPVLLDSNVISSATISYKTKNTGYYVILYYGEEFTDNYNHYDIYINWDDIGNESKRPDTVNGSWTATYKNNGKTQSDTFSFTTNKKAYSQYITIDVPKGSDESGTPTSSSTYAYTNLIVDIPAISGYRVSKINDDDFKWKLTYDPSTIVPEPVIDAPSGYKVEFDKAASTITATLTNGTTMPLVAPGTTTTISINSDTTPSSYGKTTEMSSFKDIAFYDIMITINDGENTYTVKSLDSTMSIYFTKPTGFDSTKSFKVYHYENGITKTPTECTSVIDSNGLIKVLTNSFSPYAIAYNGGTASSTTVKEVKITWDDAGHENERPTSVVVDYTAKYSDGTEKSSYVLFDKDTSATTQTKNISVNDTEGTATLTGVTASVRNVTYYSITKDTSGDLAFKLKYTGNTSQVITSTFGVKFENDTADVRPTSVDFDVYCLYDDGSRDNRTVTINVGADGTGEVQVTFPITNDAGSSYNSIRWDYPDINNYTLVSTGRIATYRYNGTNITTPQTDYTVTVKFSDAADKTKRPTSVPITWTATTASSVTTTGTATINVNTTADSFSTNVTVPAATNESRTVVFAAPTLTGYGLQSNGTTFTYTLTNGTTSTAANVEIIFEDDNNKAGRRPSSLTVTLKDSNNDANTVTANLQIANNTTTTIQKYNTSVNIPTGSTYVIKEVKELPTGYTASYSGLSATLKYTPETVNKTYSVKFDGDVESVRPSSVSITVKSGDTTGATLTVSKDTNWSATATLSKYIKGVEAAWTPSVSSVSNYSTSISGDTITLKYTGTLTEEQKAEAAKATGTGEAEKEKENDLYNFDKFDWIDYANRYPDVKKAFGYNKEALYAHYIHFGIAEGRVATFTGKYENVNEEILKAYFPNDYKYKVTNTSSAEQMANGISGNSTTVTSDSNGNTVIKENNGDGTVTETVLDKDGNIISTKTYTTGDFRTDALAVFYVLIAIIGIALFGIYYYEFSKSKKTEEFVKSSIKS